MTSSLLLVHLFSYLSNSDIKGSYLLTVHKTATPHATNSTMQRHSIRDIENRFRERLFVVFGGRAMFDESLVLTAESQLCSYFYFCQNK